MFKKPTVFVLGAGASWHYGYPTGEELVRAVQQKSNYLGRYFADSKGQPTSHMPQYVLKKMLTLDHARELAPANRKPTAWAMAADDCWRLSKRLQDVDPLVIDYFLGHNSELQELGKMLTAWVLRQCETQAQKEGRNINREKVSNRQGLPVVADDNWIRFVVHRLVVGSSNSNPLLNNHVTFVTFNYDMSLEDQIKKGLRANSSLTTEDVNKFFEDDRVLHVYGKIRDAGRDFEALPSFQMLAGAIDPSFARDFLNTLSEISRGIRTIDPHEKTDETTLVKIRSAIHQARCIYILGFGFDRNNCERIALQPDKLRSSEESKSVLFTNYNNSNRINKAASKVLTGASAEFFLGQNFTYQAPLLGTYFEKSVRNCYDALAFDFDEIEED